MTRRPGVSLAELIVALGIFSVLLATSLGFYKQQGDAFTEGNLRMTLMQNLRYGITTLEQNLRTAGVGVVDKQPVLVFASERAVAFNSNYASNVENDFFAVYYDPRLPALEASAITPARAFTIPTTSFAYPDSGYAAGGGNSPAETITFFFALDTGTPRADDYALYRQVNENAPEMVARHLLETDRPFFSYYKVADPEDANPVVELPAASLPAAHTAAIHGAPDDIGASARVDSVRGIRVTFAATNGLEGEDETVREITRLIRLPNAGAPSARSCGSPPILGVSLGATGVKATATTSGHILLAWSAAVDEVTGERDVLRYVIWRRPESATAWSDPLVSIPPGAASYTYQDFSATVNQKYRYALAAQDCTPQYSTLAETGEVQWTP